MFAIVVEVS